MIAPCDEKSVFILFYLGASTTLMVAHQLVDCVSQCRPPPRLHNHRQKMPPSISLCLSSEMDYSSLRDYTVTSFADQTPKTPKYDQISIYSVLLSNISNITTITQSSPIACPSRVHCAECIRVLLDAGATIDRKAGRKYNSLAEAISVRAVTEKSKQNIFFSHF